MREGIGANMGVTPPVFIFLVEVKNWWEFSAKGNYIWTSLGILLNWRDMRSVFKCTTLCDMQR